MKKALFLFFCLGMSVSAFAGRPKIGPGCVPGINDGEGNTTGGGTNTEVTLPVGLPVNGSDPAASSEPSGSSNIVYTFDLVDDNGASSVNQTHSALEKARELNAACVLIRINDFAGGWDAAENIRQEIQGYDRPVMVYVNNQAVPAATFISSGADSIYTKKGSTISNKNGITKNRLPVNGNVNKANNNGPVASTVNTAGVLPSSSEEYSRDITMNEILFKAGLGNLTVIQHAPGFSEKATDFLMNPFVVLVVLLLIGFVMQKTAKGKLPGPLMYALAVMLLLYLAPFQLSGLANSGEILASLVLVIASVASARYNKRWLTGIFLVMLTFAFGLVRAGDTDALLNYGSFSELLSLPSVPLGLVILGWWLGKVQVTRGARRSEMKAEISGLASAA